MTTAHIDPSLTESIAAIDNPRVQEIAKELAEYGLGVSLPHLHENEEVVPLPADKIQYENDLKVQFLDLNQFEKNRTNGFPVMWRYLESEGKAVPCAWCHDT